MTPQDKQEIISKCRRVDRTGLYIMVYLCMMGSCVVNRDSEIVQRLSRIESAITNAAMNTNRANGE